MRAFFVAVLTWLAAAAASAQPAPDARAEVASALYAASATQDEIERGLRADMRALQQEIERLRAAGDARVTELEEQFVAMLAAERASYARVIGAFRDQVQDIASTPEGVEALQRYNAGDIEGALGILDRLAEAQQEARETRNRIEDAADQRVIANLAFEAAARGRMPLDDARRRYQAVIDTGGAVALDHLRLGELEGGAGMADSSWVRFETALAMAASSKERTQALMAMAAFRTGSLNEQMGLFERVLVEARAAVLEDPDDVEMRTSLLLAESSHGALALILSNAPAEERWRGSLALSSAYVRGIRALNGEDPGNWEIAVLLAVGVAAHGVLELNFLQDARPFSIEDVSLASAIAHLEEAARTFEGLHQDDPHSLFLAQQYADALWHLALAQSVSLPPDASIDAAAARAAAYVRQADAALERTLAVNTVDAAETRAVLVAQRARLARKAEDLRELFAGHLEDLRREAEEGP